MELIKKEYYIKGKGLQITTLETITKLTKDDTPLDTRIISRKLLGEYRIRRRVR